MIARHAGVDAERFEEMSLYWQNRYRASFISHNQADARRAEDRQWEAEMNRRYGAR